jgi:hypothetical protein
MLGLYAGQQAAVNKHLVLENKFDANSCLGVQAAYAGELQPICGIVW